MKELVPVKNEVIGEKAVPTVNARDLHAFLESKQEFSAWVRNRIDKFGFIEGKEFLIALSKSPGRGRPQKDYYLTIHMAKELSMVEGNEKGKQARQYFIRCEEELHRVLECQMRSQIETERARTHGRLIRRQETDTIQAFVSYATAQGSSNAKHYYANLTKMTYKHLFLLEQGLSSAALREFMDAKQLVNLSTCEDVVAKALKDGMAELLPYKAIYTLAKDRVVDLSRLVGRSAIGQLPSGPESLRLSAF